MLSIYAKSYMTATGLDRPRVTGAPSKKTAKPRQWWSGARRNFRIRWNVGLNNL